MIILKCPHCGSRDEYPEPKEKEICTDCGKPFNVVAGKIAEARHVPPSAAKYKPFSGMPERTPEENALYHREMIDKGLRQIIAWAEGGPSPRIGMDMTAATEYLEAFNAMCINTASLSWVLGFIEFLGDIQTQYKLITRPIGDGCPNPNAPAIFLDWLHETIEEKKQANYAIMQTLKENLRLLEIWLG